MSTAIDERSADQKAGFSTNCRAGNHSTCQTIGARCACTCHSDKQETRAPAPASVVVRAVKHDSRLAVLQALADNDGGIEHTGGRAVAVLQQAVGLDAGVPTVTNLLGRMAEDGLIERDVRGTKCFAIDITEKGEAFLDGSPAPTPEPKEPAVAVAEPEAEDDGLVWAEPPRLGRSREPALTDKQVEALRSRPGAWARVRTFPAKTSAGTMAARCKKGDADVPEGKWEYRAARHEAGSALYVRFIEP